MSSALNGRRRSHSPHYGMMSPTAVTSLRRGADSRMRGGTGIEAEHRVEWTPPEKTGDGRRQARLSPGCLRTDECERQYPRSDNNAQNPVNRTFISFNGSLVWDFATMSKSKKAVSDKVTLRRRGSFSRRECSFVQRPQRHRSVAHPMEG